MAVVLSPFTGLVRAAGTPVTGFALQNATPTILSWTTPNDGHLHRATLWAVKHVTSGETGGAVGYVWTLPDGTLFNYYTLDSGGNSAGVVTDYAQPWNIMAAPGTTVSIIQASALTAGASVLWAEIWGN